MNGCTDSIGDLNGNSSEISRIIYVDDTLMLFGAEEGSKLILKGDTCRLGGYL